MEDATYNGPYKATRMWNDVIISFRQYLPCGRHRRYMRTYDNCFSGASATEWLLQYLKTHGNFGPDVSRDKATSLLNKLYRAGVFEEVQVSKSMRHKQDVHENRLYKFMPITPSKVKISRLPLAPRNDAGVNYHQPKIKSSHHKHDFQEETKQKHIIESDITEKKPQSKLVRKISVLKKDKSLKEPEVFKEESYPSCHLITKVLTTREIKATWKTAFILRSSKVLGVKNLDDIISPDLIDGYNVMHNCIYLNKSGIVTNIDAKQQLPHWVMSAMKCLARWPEPPEPGLPNYPGFEKDVFGVVKDYFLNQDQPLVPYNLYDVVTNVFVMAGSSQARHSSPHHYDSESSVPNTLWSSASLENIILNLTKKYCLLDNTGDQYGTHEDLQFTNGWFAGSVDENCGNYNNHNTFPSTDGMDKLGQKHHNKASHFSLEQQSCGLSNRTSCPSMPMYQSNPAPNSLSRTTQSAKETNAKSDRWLSGISRKYGSAPNLKVSRFETAFGPDNRTVTRVFYQNGMTTDYGHDEDDGSFCHQNGSCENDIDRVQSNNCLYDNGSVVERKTYLNGRPMARSKSFADVKQNTKHNIFTETICSKKINTSFTDSIVRSSSFNGNSSKLNNSNHGSLINSSKEALYETANELYTASDEPIEKVLQNSIHSIESHHSDAVLASHNSSLPLTCETVTSQEHPHERKMLSPANNLNSNTCQPYLSLPTASNLSTSSVLSLNEERDSSILRRKPVMAGNYGPGYRERHTLRSERSISSLGLVKSTSSLLTHDLIQGPRLSCDSTPPMQGPSFMQSKYGPGYKTSNENQEAEYNIVLDASKKRSVPSSTNLAQLQHSAPSYRIQSTFNQTANQPSSRPSSPHYHKTASVNDLDYVPGLNFSSITPFSSQNSQSGKKSHLSTFMNYPQTRLSEDRVKNSLQMVTLLLPPGNRRKLHLLFKMMTKMTLNPNLCLDPTQTTRSLVLGTFYPVIVRSPEDCDLDEVVQLQLMSFMLDYYDDIFTPPSDMKTHVSERLKALQRPQVVYSPKPERTVRFCQQTSLSDFENQRISSSQKGLASLLEDIVSDQNMNVKEKRKRMKQFQNTYPTIYNARFPDAKSEAKVLPQNPKLKEPLIAKPLYKLRSLRL